MPFALAAKLLAASATFQALVGAADAAAALAYIDHPYRDCETAGYRIPGGYLFDDESCRQFKEHKRGKQGGELFLVLSAAPSETHAADPENDMQEWRNTLGAILADMEQLAGGPVGDGSFHLGLTRWDKYSIGWMTRPEEERDDDPDEFKTFRIGLFKLTWV